MNQVKEQWRSINQKNRKCKTPNPFGVRSSTSVLHFSIWSFPFFPQRVWEYQVRLNTHFGCQIWAACKHAERLSKCGFWGPVIRDADSVCLG